jgi:hypothetical protein
MFIPSNPRPRQRWLISFSLNPVVFPDLDDARLKRTFEYFVEHYTPAELNARGSHPVKLLERDEPSRMSRAKRALAVAIADFVEGTQDFCRERVSEIDRDLAKREAYTLTFLREHFTTRRRNRI